MPSSVFLLHGRLLTDSLLHDDGHNKKTFITGSNNPLSKLFITILLVKQPRAKDRFAAWAARDRRLVGST